MQDQMHKRKPQLNMALHLHSNQLDVVEKWAERRLPVRKVGNSNLSRVKLMTYTVDVYYGAVTKLISIVMMCCVA